MLSIRLKLLLTLLFLVTLTVSVVATIMGIRMREDRSDHLFAMTSSAAHQKAKAADVLLESYKQQMDLFLMSLLDETLDEIKKDALRKRFFSHSKDILSVTLSDRDGNEQVTVYNEDKLHEVGIEKTDFLKNRRRETVRFIKEGEIILRNSTLSLALPSFTMAYQVKIGTDRHVLSADIHLHKLLGLVGTKENIETFLVDAQGMLIAHSVMEYILKGQDFSDEPVVRAYREGRGLSGLLEYDRSGVPYLGLYARSERGLFGVVVQTPKTVSYGGTVPLIRTLLMASFGLLIFSLFIGFVWSMRITRPIQSLIEMTSLVSSGDFDVHLHPRRKDEIGLLVASFNGMTSQLKMREEKLRSAQSVLLRSERMAAFEQLAADVVNEVKNPVEGILVHVRLALQKDVEDGLLKTGLVMIEREAKACEDIIGKLIKFASQEPIEFSPVDLNQVVDDTLSLMGHVLVNHGTIIEKTLAHPLGKINGDRNHLMQVLMNLMVNAQQAMADGGGMLKIVTLQSEDNVGLLISDTGNGIPKEIHQKIFEPFFTTKPVGKGMGLAVAYGIIKGHGGHIRVESKEGEGTTFILTFPVLEEVEEAPKILEATLSHETPEYGGESNRSDPKNT